MNNVETRLCKAVCEVLQGLLTDAAIRGNLVVDGTFKGVQPTVGPKIDVTVKPRRYDGYSSPMAEFDVILDGAYPAAADTSLGRTLETYDTVATQLDEYHHNLAPVKRDFTVDGFTPVGFKLGGNGDIDIDPNTKKRYFTLQFTLKGRIS